MLTSIFTCVMKMISNSPIIYTFREFFQDSFSIYFHILFNIFLHLDVILILLSIIVEKQKIYLKVHSQVRDDLLRLKAL